MHSELRARSSDIYYYTKSRSGISFLHPFFTYLVILRITHYHDNFFLPKIGTTTLEFEVKMKNGHEYKTSWHRFFQSLKYYGNWPSKRAYLPPQT